MNGLTMREALEPVRAARGDRDVVITTMSAATEWMAMGPLHPLDHVFVPSCMGHATSVALGIALAQPDRRVVVLNGDGSMLMNLGSLVTIGAHAPTNLLVVILENGVYEVTGSQPMPGTAKFGAIAGACGFHAYGGFADAGAWANSAPKWLQSRNGPTLLSINVIPDATRPAPKSPGPAAARAAALKAALAG